MNNKAARASLPAHRDDRHLQEEMLHTPWAPLHESEHVVQFYETDDFLIHALSEFIGTGLATDACCIVVATPLHRAALDERLQSAGWDVIAARTSGQYIALDVTETLAAFMHDGLPDPDRFSAVIGALIARATRRGRPVRVFGEMVALLWAERQYNAALQLEGLWNTLQMTHTFVLFCAYPIHDFADDILTHSLSEICTAHTRAIPAESYTMLATTDDRLRTIIQLQQQARTLEQEIAERKAAEARLRESEQRYRRLFETAVDGIVLVDAATHQIIDANPAMTTLLGFPYTNLIGKTLWDIGLFADRAATMDVFQALQEHTTIHSPHAVLPTYDGQQRDVECISTIYNVHDQQIVQCNLRDITQRVQAEALLRQREQELTDFFENATIGLHWVGPDGRILWANRAELELLGYTPEEYLGHHIAEFHADPEVIHDILARLNHGEDVHNYEARLMRKDGTIRYVLISSNVYWEDDHFIHTRCFTRDITDRKLAEQEREELLAREQAARREAQEAVHMRNVFLSIAAHELRTPLTSLLGHAQLLQRRIARERTITPTGMRAIGVIAEQAQRLNKLILALLDISRIETGQLSLERGPLDLGALVQRVVEETQLTLAHHHIDCQLPSGPLMMDGDALRLEQVVQNLLTNAVKYSPEGGSIVVHLEQQAAHVCLQVRDSGIGIPAVDQAHLFQQFYRGSNTDLHTSGGLGIGLYTVKEIVTLHGGTITVDSQEGVGSTFTVRLPISATG